jgi:olefin beta-lactone synthetase
VTPTAANAPAKIDGNSGTEYLVRNAQCDNVLPSLQRPSPSASWHRTGDIGYFDEDGRFWYCGRKSHRVVTKDGTLFTECVEAIANTHPAVRRSALVGIGPPGEQTPVLVVERKSGWLRENWDSELMQLVRARVTIRSNGHLLVKRRLPVDVRHNAKINREQLAIWAAERLFK